MKQALLLATVFVAVAYGELEKGLRVRFSSSPTGFGESAFYNVPKTVADAKAQGYTQEKRPKDGHMPCLVMYCADPPALCVLYDDTDYVAGLQIALSQDKFNDNAPDTDMTIRGFTEWIDSKGKKYWTIQEFFVSHEFLATDKNTRLASRNSNKLIQLDSVWVVGPKNQLYRIPRNMAEIETTAFTKQSCVPGMGQHHFYNMTLNTTCTPEALFPWFTLYDAGTLIGVGFITYGAENTDAGDREWFERPSKAIAKLFVPIGPPCLYELADNPGLLSMHTYFVDDPRLIVCPTN